MQTQPSLLPLLPCAHVPPASPLPPSPPCLPIPIGSQHREECLALLAKIDLLEQRLVVLEKRVGQGSGERKRKKNRRRNEQLSKRFKCLVKECPKLYDSPTSLKYHLRVKHQINIKKKRLQEAVLEIAPHK